MVRRRRELAGRAGWEHAFYLQYRNVKADYVKAWWNVANWADVTRRFATARAGHPGLITS
jgi:superoxide dismutase, Fe-Mn family